MRDKKCNVFIEFKLFRTFRCRVTSWNEQTDGQNTTRNTVTVVRGRVTIIDRGYKAAVQTVVHARLERRIFSRDSIDDCCSVQLVASIMRFTHQQCYNVYNVQRHDRPKE